MAAEKILQDFTQRCGKALGRAVQLCLHPEPTWSLIRDEEGSPRSLFNSYLIYLAAIPPLAGLIGLSLVGVPTAIMGSWRTPFFSTAALELLNYLLMIGALFVTAKMGALLADKFGATAPFEKLFVLLSYSLTPLFLGGIFQIVPPLASLGLLCSLYSLYLFWNGFPRFVTVSEERRLGFGVTIIVLLCVVLSATSTISFLCTPRFSSFTFTEHEVSTDELQNLEQSLRNLGESN